MKLFWVIPLFITLSISTTVYGKTNMEEILREAQSGDPHAQVQMGYHFDQSGDFKKAVEWYSKSAEKGYPPAQFNLAEMIRDGDGIDQDAALALSWYEKAASKRYPKALYNAGIMYATGEGAEEDLGLAYVYLALSEFKGADGGKEAKELIAKNMTEDSRNSAEAKFQKLISK